MSRLQDDEEDEREASTSKVSKEGSDVGLNPTALPDLNIAIGDDYVPIQERNHPEVEEFVLTCSALSTFPSIFYIVFFTL